MKNIDNIFKNSEHQKKLNVRPELWDRLDRQLDEMAVPSKRFFWRSWMIAASLILLLSVATLLYLNTPETYEVEDMSVQLDPHFSKEEIAKLKTIYYPEQVDNINPERISYDAADLIISQS